MVSTIWETLKINTDDNEFVELLPSPIANALGVISCHTFGVWNFSHPHQCILYMNVVNELTG